MNFHRYFANHPKNHWTNSLSLDSTFRDTAEAAPLDSQTTVGATLGVLLEVLQGAGTCKWVGAWITS